MPPTTQQQHALRAITAAFHCESSPNDTAATKLQLWRDALQAIDDASNSHQQDASTTTPHAQAAARKLASYVAHIQERILSYGGVIPLDTPSSSSNSSTTRPKVSSDQNPVKVATNEEEDYLGSALQGFNPAAAPSIRDVKEAQYLELLESLAKSKKAKLQQSNTTTIKSTTTTTNTATPKSFTSSQRQHVDPLDEIDKRLSDSSPLPIPSPAGLGGGPPKKLEDDDIPSTTATRAPRKRDQDFTLSAAGANYNPRTSEVVLRGIEVAAKLMGSGNRSKTKQAVDVLQHVYYEGRLETHNTRSFETTMKEAILDARRKYYKDFPPRLLQDNPIDPVEMTLLRSSGQTSTILLPIWDDGYASENTYFPLTNKEKKHAEETLKKQMRSGTAIESALDRKLMSVGWVDPSSPAMAPKQKLAGAKWMRAPQILSSFESRTSAASSPAPVADVSQDVSEAVQDALSSAANSLGNKVALITTCDPLKIKQTLVGDCSLVCSLIVCADFQKRFPKATIISNAIYPQEASSEGGPMLPIINPEGKYCVKMLINGITRMVVVDDRLPVGGDGEKEAHRLLCSYSTDPKEMWVSILEKAFVKVCGGTYDFPGSTSSTDLYKLSGWLPDYIAFDDKQFDADLQWRRLSANHKAGTLLATLNTPSNMDKSVADKLKLVPGHAYAILSFQTVNGNDGSTKRLVKIKNPWTNNSSWGGMFSFDDNTNFTEEMRASVGYSESEANQGVFWMLWSDVVRYFTRCHLSWNPYHLFGSVKIPTRIARHGTSQYTETMSLKPQFHVIARNNLGRNTRLHFVLSRHIIDLGEYNIKPLNRLVDEESDSDVEGSKIGDDRCPAVRTKQTIHTQGGGATPQGDDPADYVPLLALYIYDTTNYPTIPSIIATGKDPLIVPFDREIPPTSSTTVPQKTPLGTVIEEHVMGAMTASAVKYPMTTSVVGRRIHGSGELPSTDTTVDGAAVKGTLIHRGIYKNLVAQTISIDCPPVSQATPFGWDGCRHFTVVVSQLLPTTKGSEPDGSRRVSKYATLRKFPFSLTLHSELPLASSAANQRLVGGLRRSKDSPTTPTPSSSPLPENFINMCAMPLTIPSSAGQQGAGFGSSASLPFGTRVSGHWIKGMSCGGTASINTFVFNPQFHLSLKAPSHLIARVVTPNIAKAVQIHVMAVHPEIGALMKNARNPSQQQGQYVPPWYGRVGQVTSNEASIALQSPFYTHNAAVVDTSLGQCLAFDMTNTMQRDISPSTTTTVTTPTVPSTPAAPPQPSLRSPIFPLPIAMKIVGPEQASHPIIYFPFPQSTPALKSSCMVVPLLAAGHLASPTCTKFVFAGASIPLVDFSGMPKELYVSAIRDESRSSIGRSCQKLREAISGLGEADLEARSRALLEAWCGLTVGGSQSNIVLKMLGGIENGAEYQGPKISVVLGTGTMDLNAAQVEIWEGLQVLAANVMKLVANVGSVSDVRMQSSLCEGVIAKGNTQQTTEICLRRCLASEVRIDSGMEATPGSVYTSSDGDTVNGRKKMFDELQEHSMQLLLKIDALPVSDARKTLVAATQATQDFLDSLVECSPKVSTSAPALLQWTSGGPNSPPSSSPALTPVSSSTTTTVPKGPLNRLPAGEYVIVLSVWEKGVPGAFDLSVETETSHTLVEIPPEGTEWTAPVDYKPTVRAGEMLLVSGYPKMTSTTTICKVPVLRDSKTARMPAPAGMYSLSAPLPHTHPLFDITTTTYLNIALVIPSGGSTSDPLTLSARVLVSLPETTMGEGAAAARPLPSICVARSKMMLFREVVTPSPGLVLIADSGMEGSGSDCCLTVTSSGKGAVQGKYGPELGGSTRLFTCSSDLLAPGRKYRLVVQVSPSQSIQSEDSNSLNCIVKCVCSKSGLTSTLLNK